MRASGQSASGRLRRSGKPDRELAKTLGETLGEECQAEDISTILGPAMNIKRSPCADGILSIIPRIRFYLLSWALLM